MTSRPRRNVARAVMPANSGARKTHTLRMLMVMLTACSALYSSAAVAIRPGKIVPPTLRPSGYHVRVSKKFWKP
jgi:hypothetical protein